MKNQIDALVAAIRASLARTTTDPQIAAVLAMCRMDGFSLAIDQRAALARIAVDELHTSAEDRAYAAEQLDALPPF